MQRVSEMPLVFLFFTILLKQCIYGNVTMREREKYICNNANECLQNWCLVTETQISQIFKLGVG